MFTEQSSIGTSPNTDSPSLKQDSERAKVLKNVNRLFRKIFHPF